MGKIPESFQEAERRFENNIEGPEGKNDHDPFPQIRPTLLDSGQIQDYVMAGGIIYPFDEKKKKASSYAISVGQEYMYWDKDGTFHYETARAIGDSVPLPKNSIVFIKTLEFFRIPQYMVMRFNVKVGNAHRGLLLGTGPVVDSGYHGHLVVPLHNLTSNDYYFYVGEDFAWAEFTKLDSGALAYTTEKDLPSCRACRVPYPKQKKDRALLEQVSEAHSGEIRSSIPDEIRKAEDKARNSQWISFGLLIAFVAIMATTMGGYWALHRDFSDRLDKLETDSEERIKNLKDRIKDLKDRIKDWE